MNDCSISQSGEMRIFLHHIYEYQKGLRNLVLHTLSSNARAQAEAVLKRKNIAYHLACLPSGKVNVFFGAPKCVTIMKILAIKPLNHFTDEEDFILGIMLGYDRHQQCERYLQRKKIHTSPKTDHLTHSH